MLNCYADDHLSFQCGARDETRGKDSYGAPSHQSQNNGGNYRQPHLTKPHPRLCGRRLWTAPYSIILNCHTSRLQGAKWGYCQVSITSQDGASTTVLQFSHLFVKSIRLRKDFFRF